MTRSSNSASECSVSVRERRSGMWVVRMVWSWVGSEWRVWLVERSLVTRALRVVLKGDNDKRGNIHVS